MKRYPACHPLSKVYVNIDSFGDRVPKNYAYICNAFNERIDKIIKNEHITADGDYPDYQQLMSITRQADELWSAMMEGNIQDIRPIYI